jgi:hypothetical protein
VVMVPFSVVVQYAEGFDAEDANGAKFRGVKTTG